MQAFEPIVRLAVKLEAIGADVRVSTPAAAGGCR